MKQLFVLPVPVLLLLLSRARCSRLQMIEQFLQLRSINSLIFLHCVQEATDYDVPRISKAIRGSFLGSIYHIDVDEVNFRQQLGWHMYCDRYRTGVIFNLECSSAETVLDRLSENAFFNTSFQWLMFGGPLSTDEATCLLSGQNINYDTRIMLVFETADKRGVRYEWFDVSGTVKRRGGKVIFTFLGYSTADSSLPDPVPPKPDLEGITLWGVVSTINQHQPRPFIENLESNIKPKSVVAYIYSYKIVKLLQMKLKFKMKIILTDDWHFDLIGLNTSLGLIGQIQSKNVDFSITPFEATTERMPYVDFTIELAPGYFYTIFRHPKSLNKTNIFLLPFETVLWFALVGTVACVAVVQAVASICHQRRERLPYNDLIIGQSFLGTVGMLCQQGFHATTTTVGSKQIAILVMMGFSLLLLQFYSTFIVGYQLISPPKTINTLEKLADSSLKMSVEDLSYQHDFFTRTKKPIALRLYNEKILPNKYGFVNLTFGIQLLKQGYAFHCDTSYAYTHVVETLTEQEICELQELQLYPQRALHLPLIKGSPLRELLKLNLQLLKEHGLLAYYRTKSYAPKPKCIKNSNKAEQIYLTDVRFAFVLLAAGLGLSVGILALELAGVRLRRWYQHRTLIVPDGFVWIN